MTGDRSLVEGTSYPAEVLLMIDQDPYGKWAMIGSLVSAGAAVLGVILAGFAGFVAYKLFQKESERDHRAEIQLRRQQASAVGFWPNTKGIWTLTNNSSLPIYDIVVGNIWHGAVHSPKITLNTVSYLDQEFQRFLAPGASAEFEPSTPYTPGCLVFRDNAGRLWYREAWELTEVRELDSATRSYLKEAAQTAIGPDGAFLNLNPDDF